MQAASVTIEFHNGRSHAPPGGRLIGWVILTSSEIMKLKKITLNLCLNGFSQGWSLDLDLTKEEFGPGVHRFPFAFVLPLKTFTPSHKVSLVAKIVKSGFFSGNTSVFVPIDIYVP